jgi:hypothetical protein
LYDLGVSCGGRFCSAHLIRTVWKWSPSMHVF